MKKTIATLSLMLFALVAQAQIVSSRSSRITRTPSEHTPIIFLDLGVGGFTNDAEGFGVDLGLRATKMFMPYVGWDILKISAQTAVDEFTDALNIQVKTGIRGVTPVLFGDSGTLFANFSAGYGYYTDMEEGGFAWEIGAGVNFNKSISLGVFYNRCDYSFEDSYYYRNRYYYNDVDVECGLVSARLSIGF